MIYYGTMTKESVRKKFCDSFPPMGTYSARMSGAVVEFEADGTVWQIAMDSAIRGIDIPCTVMIDHTGVAAVMESR